MFFSNLLQNEPIELGLKQWGCPFCGKISAARTQSITHIRIHTGDKPFKCDKCSYACNTKGGLKSHINFRHVDKL